MVRHNDGKIALKWAIQKRAPKAIKIDGEDKYYIFVPKLNIFMAWVEPNHVDRLLAHKEKTCNCNNGTYQLAFVQASLLDVNLWETGNRYGFPDAPYREITENG